MIPIRDTIPSVSPSIAVAGIIAVNALVFFYSQELEPRGMLEFFHLYGVVPARFLKPDWAAWIGYPDSFGWPFASYMFLHSSWLHIIFNMWMLWIFGDNIEDVTGHLGFVVFYVVCGLAAVGLHMAFEPTSTAPVVGASGAVAGVMGAYFILYPHGRVLTLVPIIIIPFFLRLPSFLFLGVWFASQVWSGVVSTKTPAVSEVAWWAHVGGFVAGMLLIQLFRLQGRCAYCYNPKTREYERKNGERS